MSKLIEDLIEEIKQKAKIDSDNNVARYADLDPSHLNIMKKRKGKPGTESYLKLAVAAGWDINKAKNRIEAGFASISMMIIVMLFSAVCFMGITKQAPTHHIATAQVQDNVYYVK